MQALIDAILSMVGPEGAAAIVGVGAVLTAALPLLERLADATATKLDNQAVALLRRVLAFVPRVRLGGK